MTSLSVQATINQLKDSDQDFEWYPTTNEIIDTIKADLKHLSEDNYSRNFRECYFHESYVFSVLDCGAGDGRVLNSLTKGTKFAIEKSVVHIQNMDKDISIIGTDFFQQTLLDKDVDIVFCNPPYSDYERWFCKILSEASCEVIYMVVPSRWENSSVINEMLNTRKYKHEVINDFDFLNADRKARANVHVIRLEPTRETMDGFNQWFDSNFDVNSTDENKCDSFQDRVKEKTENALVENKGLIYILEEMYQEEMGELFANYKSICDLNAVLLDELGIDKKTLKTSLKSKIDGLKNKYWKELFDNLSSLSERLTSKTKEKLFKKLFSHVNVDFTADNASAIVIWAIKNTNNYMEEQFVEVFEKMIEDCNVINYKSNQRTFKKEQWRYNRHDHFPHEKFMLDYRIVVHCVGGIVRSDWAYERERYNGLSGSAKDFIDDLCIIASNVGFDTYGCERAMSHTWSSGKAVKFMYRKDGVMKVLFEAKAFKNGNIHLKLNQDFICSMNVEYGRVKGWVKNKQDVVDEMGIPEEKAEKMFKATSYIPLNSSLKNLLPKL